MSGEVPASVRGIAKVIPRVPVIDPGADILIERTMVAPTTLTDVGVTKMTPMVACL